MHATKKGERGLSDPADTLERIEEVLRLSRSAVWEVDRQGVYTYASRSHEALLGYGPGELVGIHTIHDFYPREVPADLQRELSEDWIGAGEEFTDRELPLVAKSGEIVWVTSHGQPIFGADGEVAGFRGADTDITARKRAESGVRRTNERMQVAARAGGIGFWEHDYRSGREEWDDGMLRLYGIQRSEFSGTAEEWLERVHPDDRGAVRAALERVQADGDQGRQDFRIVRPGGEVRYIASVWMVSRDAAGRAVRMTGMNQDVTSARAGESRLLAVVENTPVPISYTLAGGEELHLNKAFTETYGWTEEDVPTADEWFKTAYPDADYRREVLALWSADVERARAGDGNIGPRLYRIRAKDGSVREVEIRAVVLEGEMFGSFLDLTERNRAERQLSESESSLRGLIENAPVGIVRMEADSGRLWVNKAFTEWLGYTQEDLPDLSTWMRCAYPEASYRERIMAEWEEALRQARAGDGKIGTSEPRVTDKRGREHEMQFSGIVIGHEIFGLWVDLTERNRAERLLRERQEQLARVGRVSTLGQLAASLAHELEQPLAAILHNAETADLLLRKGQRLNPEELGAIITDILADDRRAGAVLDRIRGMVRQRKFAEQPVEVEALLHEAARLVRPAAAQRMGVEISCEPGLPVLEGDPVLLQQALLNLLLNAIEAIGERTDGRIVLHAGEARPGYLEISVGDNGGGVAEGQLGKLFEPFHTTKADGLGMGLPLVRSIVEEHGGQVRLSNQPGRGLTVALQLPVPRAGLPR
jgi:PAS domain S-box-containing protein